MWVYKKCKVFKNNDKIGNHVRTHLICGGSPSYESFLAELKCGPLFGNVQCNLVVQDEQKSDFANYPPVFKNTEVGRNDIEGRIKINAVETEIIKLLRILP